MNIKNRALERTLVAGAALAALLSVGNLVGCDKARADVSPPHPEVAMRAPAAAPSPETQPVHVGSVAPDVTLVLQDGFALSLPLLHGKLVVLVFCGADDALGCNRETAALRDHWTELHERFVSVVGVRGTDALSNKSLIAEGRLPFDFATDPEGTIAHAFGVSSQAKHEPTTFVVGRNGSILAVWPGASPETHVSQILAFAKSSATAE